MAEKLAMHIVCIPNVGIGKVVIERAAAAAKVPGPALIARLFELYPVVDKFLALTKPIIVLIMPRRW